LPELYQIYRANSGLQKTEEGLKKYMDLRIPAAKLVLGVPWYGYNYECINLAEVISIFIKSFTSIYI
jgi:GH18 family chitinase